MAQVVSQDTATPPASPPPNEPDDGMTMLEHLEELRQRLIASAIAFVLGLIASAIPLPPTWEKNLAWTIIDAVVVIIGVHNLQAIQPGEVFFTYFQVALLIGFSIALPVILFQAMAFVLPALYQQERKYLYMAVPGALASFLIGISFGYLIVVPAAITFLFSFGQGSIEQKWSFSAYVDAVTTLLFWMGVAFEMPLTIFFLCKIHVLNVQRLKRFRKYALLGSFIIGALITPTPDPFNQTLVSLPIYLLFEIGILLARLA